MQLEELTLETGIGLFAMGLGTVWLLLPTWMMRAQSWILYLGRSDRTVWEQPRTGRILGRLSGLVLAGLGAALYYGLIP